MEEHVVKKSWWKRNWKWALPVGGCLTIIVVIVVSVGTVAYGIVSAISESPAQQDAMAAVAKNEQVIALLGEPIEPNGMTGGTINKSNGLTTANISIPIKGPKGEATIKVEGEGIDDNWNYDKMLVFVNDSDTVIDLLVEDWDLEEIEDEY